MAITFTASGILLSPWARLLALTAVALVLRLLCFTGLIGSDDMGYAGYAQQIADGTYHLDAHHYAIRFGVIVPVGALYAAFGANEWTTIALPLVASTLSVPLIVLIGHHLAGWRVGLIAGALYATFPLSLRYATILVPEPMAECLVLVAVLCYLKARDRGYAALGAGLFLGLAYLTKEPAVFIAPALGLDALWRRQWRTLMLVSSGVLIIIGLEHALYAAHGDVLFRPHAMRNHEQTAMALGANANLSWRLWQSYPRMMLIPSVEMGLHSLTAITLAAYALRSHRAEWLPFVALWTVLPWLYLNFGSSNLTRYFALPAGARYLLLTYAPLMLLAAIVLARLRRTVALATVATLAIIGITCGLMTKQQGWRTADIAAVRAGAPPNDHPAVRRAASLLRR